MAKQAKTAEVRELTDSEFESFIKEKNITIIDFWAEWCMPCLIQGPIVEELAQHYSGKIAFAKLNVDDNQVTSSKFKVLSIPTLLVFKNGQMVERVVGTMPFESLKERLDKHLK